MKNNEDGIEIHIDGIGKIAGKSRASFSKINIRVGDNPKSWPFPGSLPKDFLSLLKDRREIDVLLMHPSLSKEDLDANIRRILEKNPESR